MDPSFFDNVYDVNSYLPASRRPSSADLDKVEIERRNAFYAVEMFSDEEDVEADENEVDDTDELDEYERMALEAGVDELDTAPAVYIFAADDSDEEYALTNRDQRKVTKQGGSRETMSREEIKQFFAEKWRKDSLMARLQLDDWFWFKPTRVRAIEYRKEVLECMQGELGTLPKTRRRQLSWKATTKASKQWARHPALVECARAEEATAELEAYLFWRDRQTETCKSKLLCELVTMIRGTNSFPAEFAAKLASSKEEQQASTDQLDYFRWWSDLQQTEIHLELGEYQERTKEEEIELAELEDELTWEERLEVFFRPSNREAALTNDRYSRWGGKSLKPSCVIDNAANRHIAARL